MFRLLCDLAKSLGSSVAELCQAMILTGSIYEYARFTETGHMARFVAAAQKRALAEKVDKESQFKDTITLLARTQSALASGPTRNEPHIEGSQLIHVRLPQGFVRIIDLYAKVTNSSRSVLLTRYLTSGILLYMLSQRALMKAITEALKGKELETSGTTAAHVPIT